jgi:hypothetical protein
MLLVILLQRGNCIFWPEIGYFLGCHAPNFRHSSITPPKGTFLRQNTRFEPSIMKIGSAVRAVREPEKIIFKKNK